MTKEELEKLTGVRVLDYQMDVINALLELRREGKEIYLPIRTTKSSVKNAVKELANEIMEDWNNELKVKE